MLNNRELLVVLVALRRLNREVEILNDASVHPTGVPLSHAEISQLQERLYRQVQPQPQDLCFDDLKKQFQQFGDTMKAAGVNFVGVLFHYGDGTEFSTRLSVVESDDVSTSPGIDHAIMDVIREISIAWSNAGHKSKLGWVVDVDE